MKLNRLIAILLLMESRGNINASELARALEVSKRTIHRDIEELCQAGVPIASNTGQSGGYYLLNGYTTSLKSLNTDEVITLYLSGIGIHPQRHTESGISLQNALLKLEKILSPSYARDIRNVRQRFLFDPENWWNHKEINGLETIRKAVLQSRKLKFTYLTDSLGKYELNVRIVHPYGMVVKHGEWYLTGYCESRKAIRNFRCDKINNFEMLSEPFIIPEEFSLHEYWYDSVEKFKNLISIKNNYIVRLKTESNDFQLPHSLEILEENDEFIVVNLFSFENAVQVIWDLKQNITVLEPEELKQHIYDLAEQILKNYNVSVQKEIFRL